LHNCGISARADGHIGAGDPVYLSYAYGDGGWGRWATRMHKVTLSLADEPKTDDSLESNSDIKAGYASVSPVPEIMTIKAEHQIYDINKPQNILIMAYDKDGMYFPVLFGTEFSGYDESVIKMTGSRITPVSPGTTRVFISWHGFTGEFTVNVTQ
ncbi:MAG: hypothetical protein IKI78_06140, partial [Clostridia bacterium]|nr:hypothetical protein [Clostridia bacterium]